MTFANWRSHPFLYLLFVTSLISTGELLNAGAQTSGSITFKDNAPPATEQQRNDAKDYYAKAQQARDRMQLLGKALRATAELQGAITKSHGSAVATDTLRKQVGAWKALAAELGSITADKLTINDKSLASYPKATLDTGFVIANAGTGGAGADSINLTTLKQLAAKTEDFLFQAYDLTAVDHGFSNIVLRTYPYFDLVGQPSVECDTLNTFSRDIKCLPVHSKGIQTGTTWMGSKNVNLAEFCHTDKLESFGRDQYGKVEMYVRKQSPIKSQLGNACWD
ncbi:MAG: hypothetical protein WCA19_02550 [Candidatus Acidiferrales bacterium]